MKILRLLAATALVALVPLAGFGAEPVGNTPEEFAAFVKSRAVKYAKLVKASGAKVDRAAARW